MQQTYVEVISGRARFEGESSLKTFLFGVAQNLTRSHFRKAAGRTRLAEHNATMIAPQGSPAIETDKFDSRRLWQAVRELSDRQRDVIELVFCNELTIEEAARVMRVSVGTARQHYSRAKDALAQKLADLRGDLADEALIYGAGNER
jgi:RNA polymerase sigma-70 factor (ECF subfamily)